MLLGGIWHMNGMLRAENWKFIFWGGMHGIALAAHKFSMEKFPRFTSGVVQTKASVVMMTNIVTPKRSNWIGTIVGVIFTFHFVCFCWIFFRAGSFTDGMVMLQQMFEHFSPEVFVPMLTAYQPVMIIMGIGFLLHFMPTKMENIWQKAVIKIPVYGKVVCLVFLIWLIAQVKTAQPVMPIYLQF
jgi:D-alanyl-lipoteichoic acid acyltransferase DltB (MBOAT superfamily)